MLRFSEAWGFGLYLLGRDPDIEWDTGILDSLIEVGSGWDLYLAGMYWPNDRYDSRIAQALLDTKDMEYIRAALGEGGYKPWFPERIRDMLMAWQGTGEE